MFTPHMAATSTISLIRLCKAATCWEFKPTTSVSWLKPASVCAGAAVYLLQDGGVSGQDDAVLDESHADPPGRSQLLRSGVEPTTLQLKVPLRGRIHRTHRQLQLPVTG